LCWSELAIYYFDEETLPINNTFGFAINFFIPLQKYVPEAARFFIWRTVLIYAYSVVGIKATKTSLYFKSDDFV
jgi:hypothetical protein